MNCVYTCVVHQTSAQILYKNDRLEGNQMPFTVNQLSQLITQCRVFTQTSCDLPNTNQSEGLPSSRRVKREWHSKHNSNFPYILYFVRNVKMSGSLNGKSSFYISYYIFIFFTKFDSICRYVYQFNEPNHTTVSLHALSWLPPQWTFCAFLLLRPDKLYRVWWPNDCHKSDTRYLKRTYIAPENRPIEKEISSSNYQFQGI